MAPDADVGGAVVLRDDGAGAQHGEARVPKNIVANTGPKASQQAVRPWHFLQFRGTQTPWLTK